MTTRPRRASLIVAVLGLAVAGVACTGSPDGSQRRSAPTADDPPASEGADREIVFPVQDSSVEQFESLLTGTLVERDGCLYVEPDDSEASVLPIWPEGFAFEVPEEGGVAVVDEAGAVVATAGEPVSMGGGMFKKGDASLRPALLRRTKPCEGPYWLVGDIAASH